jgi:pentalenic acid synthase
MTILSQHHEQTFPKIREDPIAPPIAYEAWREDAPATQVTLQDGSQAWVVLRHEEVRQVLEDPSVSRDPSVPHFPRVRAGQTFTRNDVLLNHMDPPLHGQFRRMLAPWFSRKRIDGLRSSIQDIVDDAIDKMLKKSGPVNLHQDFSLAIPSRVICQFLDIDYSYHQDFERLASINTSANATAEEFESATRELLGIASKIVDEQLEEPGGGIVASLATKLKAGEITREQAIAHTHILIVAGHETTAHTISLGMLMLWRNPETYRRLRHNPTEWGKATDEMIRMQSVADGVLSRVTTQELDLGGIKVPAGQGIIPILSPANYDPRFWEDPKTFNIDRDTTKHVGLGAGIHSCLGQNLARAELEIAFETLTRRIPTLRLAVPEDEMVFNRDGFVFGVRDVPVTW